MQETIYVGLDLGSSRCQQTVMSAEGLVRFSRTVLTSEQHLRVAFDKLGGDVRVHIEAGELAGWVGSILKPMVSQVVVSHPRSLAWIGKDSVKDDRVDAAKLAELLRLGRVHEAQTLTLFFAFAVGQLSSAFSTLRLRLPRWETPLVRQTPTTQGLFLPDNAQYICRARCLSVLTSHIQGASRLPNFQFYLFSYTSRSPRVSSRALIIRTVSPSSVC